MAEHDTGRTGRPELPGLPALLGAALRDGEVDGEAERRAVEAFLEAFRDAGRRTAPTRRQDDWRPRGTAS
ncbi:hypothetical protein [Streptomyces sp. NPDC050528]|uniref:hypothetical protein n=1 Tax=Streptomyces sp. NPDC050528 TaxID=3365623 RepID=UPI0037906AE7